MPKQLRISVSVPVTEESTLDLAELSEVCGRLLMRRSTHSQSKYYLREWKRANLMRLRSGLMYGISRGDRFTEAWTSLVRAIRASPSAMLGCDKVVTTPGICGPISGEGSKQFDLRLSFSKTWRATSRWDSPASSATWRRWVTAVRGESSARRNAVRRTGGTESSSSRCLMLPTPCANEDSFRLNGSSQQSKTLEAMARRGELRTAMGSGTAYPADRLSLVGADATMVNLDVIDAASGPIRSTTAPMTAVHIVESVGQSGVTQLAGPLSPSFVEVMMGVPIGWTACASSETGSSQPSPP